MDYFSHFHKIERFELLENGKCYPSNSDISLRSQLYFEKKPITSISFFKSNNIPPSEVLSHLSEFKKVEPDQKFGPSYAIFWFKIDIEISEPWLTPENEIHLLWDSGNEALLFNSDCTKILQGFSGDGDYNKRAEYIIRRLPIKDDLNSSLKITYFLEMSCNNLFGNGPMLGPKDHNSTYTINTCSIGLFNRKAWDLLCDFIIIKDSADKLVNKQSNRSEIAMKTANSIMDIVKPSDPNTYALAKKLTTNYLNDKNSPSQHQIYAIGHCHIDTAWLWDFETTRKKTARSWSTQLELMDHYKDFKFCASQAQQYDWLKKDYPSLFGRIQEKAKEKRFIPVGGTWVEFDGNVPSGESMVRQFLYGQYFFKENFGEFSEVFFMPDTFGYSPQLPQIMHEAGIHNFLTQKLSWNLVNKFPHSNFIWKGIDGTKVLSHFPPADNYCSQGKLEDVLKSQTNFKGKEKSNCSVLLFGNGDGGGGPKMDFIESLIRMEDLEGVPKVKFADIKEFYSELKKNENNLSTWDGELYLELHNGTYTTMAENKKFNRKFELKFRLCEILFSLNLSHLKQDHKTLDKELGYYHGEFKDLWKLLLLDQFHDVLPGTSIPEVYQDTRKHFAKIDEELNKKIDGLLENLSESMKNENNGFLCFNALNYEREVYLEINNLEGFVKIPSFSLSFKNETSFENILKEQKEKCVFVKESLEIYEISNKFFILSISKSGVIISLKDKRTMQYSNEKTMKEIISKENQIYAGGNSFLIHDDVPFFWDAWDIFPYYKDNHRSILAYESKIIRDSAHQVNILFKYRVSSESEINQNVIVYSNSARVDFRTEINWHESHKLLRTYFPVNIRTDYATFDIQNGTLRRATHNNTSWDEAKHEVYGHKFVDLSDNNYGVSLLNDSKYGYSAKEGLLGLSLLKSPKHPNENADMGVHNFVYSLFLHEKSGLEETLMEAELLNEEVVLKKIKGSEFCLDFVKIDKKNVILDCLKPSEIGESLILRVHEHLGHETCFEVSFSSKVVSGEGEITVTSVDILENEKKEGKEIILGVSGKKFVARVKPFQILTFKIKF